MKRTEAVDGTGTKPVFDSPLHVGQINLPPWERFQEAFNGIFDRQFYSNHGPLVRELDQRLAEYLKVKHVVTMTNGTVALMAMAKGLGLEGEVIMPAFTFVATAQAMTWAGLTPVFCDIDPQSHNITPELVEPLISERTSAILGVHLWGRPCDVEGLEALANHHSIKLMFDSAHAMGCSHKGRMIGGFGQVEAFSMHATKVCNALEGGFVASNDEEIMARIRTVRNFHLSETLCDVPMRINGKMSEAQAAVGLLSLEEIEDYIDMNKARYQAYKENLADVPGLNLVEYDLGERNNFHYVIIQVQEEQAGLSRDALVRYFTPGVHKMFPYRKWYPQYIDALPNTDRLSRELMQLPNGQSVSLSDVERVCELIRNIQSSAGGCAAM
jgi:dTDP-4-amino-4,6-dideoxygalactose transaminase